MFFGCQALGDLFLSILRPFIRNNLQSLSCIYLLNCVPWAQVIYRSDFVLIFVITVRALKKAEQFIAKRFITKRSIFF